MELLNNLGINAKLLIAQIINFLVLLFVLYKFAYGPVLKILNERTKKIEKGLKDAETAQKKLTEISEKEKAVLIKARKEAQEIVDKAEKVAVKNKEEIIEQAKIQSEKILSDSAKKIETEKVLMFQEVKKQVAGLVVAATGKIIDEKMDAGKDKELIEKAIK
jgi:F-type H+-transporting ATPase subunit b